MSTNFNRRRFLEKSVAASAGIAVGLKYGASSASVSLPDPRTPVASVVNGMPRGRIGNLEISRLISGGNLISGWAHSRDLIYVPELMRHYNTDEKVMDTLELLEQHGVNTIIADPSERPTRIFPKYWKERGGKIQWIAEGHPDIKDLETNISRSVDLGASAIYIQGVIGDRWYRSGHIDLLGDCVTFIKSHNIPGGIGAHNLDVIKRAEEAGYGADFYVKTLHHTDYWSTRKSDQTQDVVFSQEDNYWDLDPQKTIAYMNTVSKPWIAFKVLAAGAIRPESGFRYSFENGADFICVGMFDFQVAEDVKIAIKTLASIEKRERPWLA